jgi:Tol biopolymer transport system component
MSPQESIAHYRIVSKLGEGGMGAVYRATDTKLNRDVAIKVLPDAFASDPDRMARFEREAQVLATLNHPNIAAIYGVEDRALILELVEGETLAECIARGPLSPEEALPLIAQIIDALEQAHDKGIVHRDLKPANIKVTPDGRIKVLDFGLAKALSTTDPSASAANPGSSPTMTMRATMAGVIMGTAGYMSPEQARGQEIDRRADIWAFGVIVYEMLRGKSLFEGPTVTDTLAAVLTREPDLAAIPPRLHRLVRLCLVRDARKRMSHISAARVLLDEPEPAVAPAVPAVLPRRIWLPWSIAGALAIATIAAGIAWKGSAPTDPGLGTVRVSVPLPPGTTFPLSNAAEWAPSPDGRNLAMVVREEGQNVLWVRPMNATAAHRLDKTEGACRPFWSPDSQSIAYFTENMLRRIPASGAASTKICDLPGTPQPQSSADGGTWSKDGTIVFALIASPLMRVSAQGGIPAPVTVLGKGDFGHIWPQFLSDGRHVLYTIRAGPDAGIYVQELGSTKRVLVLKSPMRGMWSPPGILLFTREGTLFAQRMSPRTFQLEGEPVTLAERVATNEGNGRSSFAVSQNGVLVYRTGSFPRDRQLRWRDRGGKLLQDVGKPGPIFYVRISPDEKSAAMLVGEPGKTDVWVMDLVSGVMTPMTRDGKAAPFAVWSPDSTRIAVALQDRTGIEQITVASGQTALLTKEPVAPDDWSPDGRSILCSDNTGTHLFLLSLSEPFRLQTILVTPHRQTRHRLSPDGKSVAYLSLETGASEVFVASFPSFSIRRRVSDSGGTGVAWAKSGNELFYNAAASRDYNLTSVAIRTGSDIQVGDRKALFKNVNEASVASGGQRFLMHEPLIPPDALTTQELSVVLNWAAEMKK